MTTVLTQKCPEGNTKPLCTRGRLFCYTAFSEDAPTVDSTFHAYGREVCPGTGRDHWQGFVYFANPRTFNSVRKLLTPHHVELCRGSLEDNEKYCSKSGNYTEIGVKPRQGTRNDLLGVVNDLRAGTIDISTIILDDPMTYHQYGRTLERAHDVILRSVKRDFVTEGVWLWGPTGSGKSRQAYEHNPDYYVKPSDGRWWDGYTGQHTVIIDDFRGDIPYGEMLRLVDRYPMYVPRRGREPFPFTSRTVIVTSSMTPEGVYHNLAQEDSLDQLYRRFRVVNVTTCVDRQGFSRPPLRGGDLP